MTTRGHHGLLMGAGVSPVSDRFSATLRTGNGSSSWSTTGPDLTGGGIVWSKSRSAVESHYIDFNPGNAAGRLTSWTTAVASASPATFTGTGASFSTAIANTNAATYVNWMFRKFAGFFDVVYYTGTGATQNIPHALGFVPAMVITKRLDGTTAPMVYHHIAGAGLRGMMNGTSTFTSDATAWNNTAATSAQFTVGTSANTNASTGLYVAFVFAHNPSSEIQGFSYVGNGSASGPTVSLGWQPQFILVKPNGTGSWAVFDQSRTPNFTGNDAMLITSNNSAETATTNQIALVSGGFQLTSTDTQTNANGVTYYGIAVKAP